MKDRPALSKGEMEVARVLWELGQGTVREVHEAFPADRPIDFATVQTYLRRLESKGYVASRLRGRAAVYAPKIQPRKVIGQTIDDDVFNRVRIGPISDLAAAERTQRQLRTAGYDTMLMRVPK